MIPKRVRFSQVDALTRGLNSLFWNRPFSSGFNPVGLMTGWVSNSPWVEQTWPDQIVTGWSLLTTNTYTPPFWPWSRLDQSTYALFEIYFSAVSGSFALSINGQVTGLLAYNASLEDVRAEIAALVGFPNVLVSGSPGDYFLYFVSYYANPIKGYVGPTPVIEVVQNTMGVTPTVDTLQEASGPISTGWTAMP